MPLSFDAMAGEVSNAPALVATEVVTVKVESLDVEVAKVVKASKRMLKRLSRERRTVDDSIVRLKPDVEVTYGVDGEPESFQHFTFASGETVSTVLPQPKRRMARTPKRQGSRLPSPQYKRGYGIEPDRLERNEYDTHDIPSEMSTGNVLDNLRLEQLARQSSRAIRRQRYQDRLHAERSTGTSERTAFGTVYVDSKVYPHG